MRNYSTTLKYLVTMAGIALVGIGLLVWLAPVSADNLTPTQNRLLDIGDGMVKISIGAILGFGGSRLGSRARNGNGNGQSEQA